MNSEIFDELSKIDMDAKTAFKIAKALCEDNTAKLKDLEMRIKLLELKVEADKPTIYPYKIHYGDSPIYKSPTCTGGTIITDNTVTK